MNNFNKKYNRKEFLNFIGKASLGIAIPPFLIGCGNSSSPNQEALSSSQAQKLKNPDKSSVMQLWAQQKLQSLTQKGVSSLV